MVVRAFIFAVCVIVGCIMADQYGNGNIANEVLIAWLWPVVLLINMIIFLCRR